MTLDRNDIEAIATRVVSLLDRPDMGGSPRLIDAAELARRLGMERSWVYSHAAELGAVRLGDGPNARLRFDPQLVAKMLRPLRDPESEERRERSPERRRMPRGKVALLPIKGMKGLG